MAGDGAGLAREMLRAAPPEVTLLPETEYAGLGSQSADYLTGKTASLPAFSEKENAHMADCRGLIALDGWVCLISLAGTAAVTTWMIRSRPGRREIRALGRGLGWSLWIAGGLALGLGIWAVADFDGFFVTFHKVAFTNDLWLLNPRTDLLIRLMPVDFFMALGRKGLLLFLPVPLAVALAACAFQRGFPFSVSRSGRNAGDGQLTANDGA